MTIMKDKLLTVSLLLFGVLFSSFYLYAFISSPGFTLPAGPHYVATMTLALLFFFVYKLFTQLATAVHLKIVLLFSLFFSFLMLWMNTFSFDVYYYVFYTKVLNDYAVSPYSARLVDFPGDNFFEIIPQFFSNVPSLYGPLFLLTYAPVQAVAGDSIFINVVAFKLVAAVVFFAAGFLLYKILQLTRAPNPAYPLLLYFWNPLLISEIIKDGHNDIWVAFFILLALFFYLKGRRVLVLPTLMLAVFFKFTPIILLPVVYWFMVREYTGFEPKIKFTFSSLLIPACSIYIFLAIIGPMPSLFTFQLLTSFNFSSIFTALLVLPSDIALPLQSTFLIGLSLGIFVLTYVAALTAPLRGFTGLTKKIVWVLLAYLFFGTFWVQVWYFVWVIPLLLAMNSARFVKLAAYLSLMSLIGYYSGEPYVGLVIFLLFAPLVMITCFFVSRLTSIDPWKYL